VILFANLKNKSLIIKIVIFFITYHSGIYNNLLIYQIYKHEGNQTININKEKPNFKGETILTNNINDKKGLVRLQGPFTITCTLLINQAETPSPNLSGPNNNNMVMSKLNSCKL